MERKKFNILVNFDGTDSITSDDILVVEGDYKSIEFDFQLSKTDFNRAVFFMVKPNGTHYVSEIENDKVLIDDNSVFNQVGTYLLGISLYGSDSRLTNTAKGKLEVVDGQMPSDDEVTAEGNYPILDQLILEKQDLLISGTNIKTINNTSLLGSGNINIAGGGGSSTDVQINGNSIVSEGIANIVTESAYNSSTNKLATMNDMPDLSGKQDTLVSGTNIKTINSQPILGSGNINISASGESNKVTITSVSVSDFYSTVYFSSDSVDILSNQPDYISVYYPNESQSSLVPMFPRLYYKQEFNVASDNSDVALTKMIYKSLPIDVTGMDTINSTTTTLEFDLTTENPYSNAILKTIKNDNEIEIVFISDSDSVKISKFESCLDSNNRLIKPVYLVNNTSYDFYLGIGLFELYSYTYNNSNHSYNFAFDKKGEIGIPYRAVVYSINNNTITRENHNLSFMQEEIMKNEDFNATIDFDNGTVTFDSSSHKEWIHATKIKMFKIVYTYDDDGGDVTENYNMVLSYHDDSKSIYNSFKLIDSTTLQYMELTINGSGSPVCLLDVKTISL